MQVPTELTDVPSRTPSPDARPGSRFTLDRVVRVVLGALALGVAAGLLWYFGGLVVYLLVGVVAAYLMRPVVDRIQGLGIGRIPAILATFVTLLGGIAVLLTFLVPFVARQVSELSQQIAIESAVQITSLLPSRTTGRATLEPGEFIVAVDTVTVRSVDQVQAALRGVQPGDRVPVVVRNAEGTRRIVVLTLGEREEGAEAAPGAPAPGGGQNVDVLGLTARTVMFSDIVTAAERRVRQFVPLQEGAVIDALTGIFETLFQEDRLTRIMGSVVGFFTDVIYAVIIIPFVAFFVLKDGGRIRRSLLRLVPNRYFEITLAIIEKVETNIGRYFKGLFLQSLSIATVATVLLTGVGLDSALAVGIFTGLANTIPYFGPLMGFLAGTLVGIAQTGDFSLVPGILLAMGLTQLADNLLFQPLIFARAARAHPLIILFVVLIGAQLAGILGMLVAIPVTAIVRVVVEQILWSLRNYRILQAG
ncbi:MAG: AI-2E family transporter [Rhodothermales bacterium]|nr:AI-2E family transporter [Rhodothermales bacterium]